MLRQGQSAHDGLSNGCCALSETITRGTPSCEIAGPLLLLLLTGAAWFGLRLGSAVRPQHVCSACPLVCSVCDVLAGWCVYYVDGGFPLYGEFRLSIYALTG